MAKLFIVEDSRAQAMLLAYLLQNAGHEVSLHGDGQAAFEALQGSAELPDLVLSDIEMPHMDGIMLCRSIKADARLREIPVLLVTSIGGSEGVIRGLCEGADGYLVKPYNEAVLLESVGGLLDRRARGTLSSVDPVAPYRVEVQGKAIEMTVPPAHLFEFFLMSFTNASVQARELDERERALKATNESLSRTVEMLSDSEDRFRSLVAAVPDVVYKIDDRGHFTFINDAIQNFGYLPGELIGQHFSVIILSEDVQQASANAVLPQHQGQTGAPPPKLFDERRTKDRMTVGLRVRILAKNRPAVVGELQALGEELVNVEVNSMGMYGEDAQKRRKYVGTVGVVRDITERVKFEQALKTARDSAISANRAKSEFLSSMSHELRTPLNAILGFAQVLDFSADAFNEDQRDSLEQIKRGGEHLLRLITDVLDLTKIESGYDQLNIESNPQIGQIIRTAARMLEPAAKERGIVIDNQAGGALPPVLIDGVRCRQIMVNLISNAVKYNQPQGRVTISARTDDRFLCISITDTGIGIAADKLDQLYQPFNRLGVQQRGIEGTGIGLVITRRLLENMGGSIEVESTAGEGSTFHARFVIDTDATAPAKETQDNAPPPALDLHGRLRILYVEDNEVNALLMHRALKAAPNLTLHVAPTAEDGLVFAQAQRPDVILMDYQLPGMNGDEATRILKATHETAAIPVIALTADATRAHVESAEEKGYFAYVTKPFKIHELLEVIARSVGNTSSRMP